MQNIIGVPESFELLGMKYTVEVIAEADWKEDVEGRTTIGTYDPSQYLIRVKEGSEQQMAQTFMHELSHAILLAMGKGDLFDDEGFVDLLGSLFQQAFQTSIYCDWTESEGCGV